MTRQTRETFLVPAEVNRTISTTPAEIYNLYRSLFIRNKNSPVFVPIRSMQFLAILDQHEINFVDSQRYAVSGQDGGRMIVLSWQYSELTHRESLDQPVACEVVSYEQGNQEIQLRLVGEFKQAMEQLDRRYRDQLPAMGCVNIVKI